MISIGLVLSGKFFSNCKGGGSLRPFFLAEGPEFLAEYTCDKDIAVLKLEINKQRFSGTNRDTMDT